MVQRVTSLKGRLFKIEKTRERPLEQKLQDGFIF